MATVKGLRERLRDGETVVCAEGYMWELERRGFVTCGDFTPEVVLDYPERVKSLYEEFAWAGSDVVEAYTYYGHREKLKAIGREGDLESLNLKALKMAREVADANGCLMAGNICNTTVFDLADPGTVEMARGMFKEQIEWALKAGADYIIAETFSALTEAKTALEAIQQYGNGLPAVITMATYAYDVTLEGVPLPEALRQLELMGADVVGLNCGRGPETMLPLLREVKQVCKGPVAALPVPVRTTSAEKSMYSARDPRDGRLVFPEDVACRQCSRSDIRQFAQEARRLGVKYIGLCCGATPALLREVAQVYGKKARLSKYAPDTSRSFYLKAGASESGLTMRAFMFGEKDAWP
ncbi:betaine--homocysteine S-methyltransferase 1 [Aplysia californica]|uniref:Betaine--homocysteine S-methyltransferase 1 n=1 Tax=Aplysia californica TaxID=6500 RepID=A0ABM1A3T2_APLCA|nr:betaine--homocysteine S-methyltransferase 1 [Aplysia californica]